MTRDADGRDCHGADIATARHGAHIAARGIVIGLVILIAIVALVAWLGRSAGLDILEERNARGEIHREE